MTEFLRNLLFVAVGGGIGSAARYVSIFVWGQFGWSSAWSVLTINLVGSFVIGFLIGCGPKLFPPTGWLFLTSGILGGYTTFSAFSMHILEMLHRGSFGLALFNIFSTLIGGIFCALLGFYLTHNLIRI